MKTEVMTCLREGSLYNRRLETIIACSVQNHVATEGKSIFYLSRLRAVASLATSSSFSDITFDVLYASLRNTCIIKIIISVYRIYLYLKCLSRSSPNYYC